MTVEILITGSCWPQFGLMWVRGQKKTVDEKQAEMLVAAGLAEIINIPETVKEKIPKYKAKR